MITNFLIRMVAGLVNGLLSLMPDWNIDTGSITGFTTSLGSSLGALNGWVPELLLFSLVGILLAVKLFLTGWRAVVFVYSLIPFN